jgi:recombination protein RecA|tara:strand:- start:1139 stop:2272 length:1134 start_codon:yes stop_codon:yes gene_type:complete
MPRPFDVSKFRKSITKAVPGLSVGFNDPDTWISTGNFTLNKLISGDFDKGIPLGKVSVLAGESGAGKSYIAAGNIVKQAQDQNIFVVLIDTENALDETWLHALDVDTSPEKLLKLNLAMIDDVAKVMSDFMIDYKKDYADKEKDERPKVLFVIDSLGMMLTPTDVKQFEAGDMKGDLGRKPKALTSLVRNTVNMLGEYNVGLMATNHTYASQDMFDPDDKISGGQGFIYASSIVVAMRKLKLKVDADGNKTSQVHGIRAACKVMKTRYAKPFESVQVEIPYETGMSPYSGLVEFLEAKEVLKKSGNSLEYTSHVTGEVIKMFRKPWNANKDGALDLIMSEWDDIAVDKANSPVIEDPEDMSEEELNSLDENLSTTEE